MASTSRTIVTIRSSAPNLRASLTAETSGLRHEVSSFGSMATMIFFVSASFPLGFRREGIYVNPWPARPAALLYGHGVASRTSSRLILAHSSLCVIPKPRPLPSGNPQLSAHIDHNRFVGRTRVAYFSMEIAIAPEMPTYSGGLGILAGDTARAAADLDLPIVFVTLISRAGFLRQELWKSSSSLADCRFI